VLVSTKRLLKYPKGHANAHLRRCASSFVIATYNLKVTRIKIRLIPQDLRALHMNIFEQPQKRQLEIIIQRLETWTK
jgi:hypothetical protein